MAVRRMELEVDREVRMRELEIQAMKIASGPIAQPDNATPPPPSPLGSCPPSAQVASAPPPSALSPPAFDVSKHIALVPPFKEANVLLLL